MNPRLLRPTPTGFNPKSIANLGLWLDASADSSLTFNASTVSEWRDLSGNGRHFAQGTAGSQPGTSTLNGRRVLSASGASFMTGNAASLNVLRNVGGGTLIVVGSLGSGDQQNLAQISSGTNAGQARLALARVIAAIGGLGIAGRRLDADSFAGAGYSAGTGSNVYTGILDYANSDAFTFAGGTQQASNTSFQTNGNTSDTDSLGTSVFGTPTGANLCTGTLAEVLLWPRVLTTAERQRVERHLGRKWGITVA
jgi:hypothetical protein